MSFLPGRNSGAVVHLQLHLQFGLVTSIQSWCPLKGRYQGIPTWYTGFTIPKLYSIYIPDEFWLCVLQGLQLGSLNESPGIKCSSTTLISYNCGKSQLHFLEPFTIFHPLHIHILHTGNICVFHLKFPTLFSVESNQLRHSARSNSRFATKSPTICLQVANVSSRVALALKDREV